MKRTLVENIARGRQAIALARGQDIETAIWEESLADLERQEILSWASEVCEQNLVLPGGVTFVEEPLRPVTMTKVSQYVADRLRFIIHAHFQQSTGGMERWLPSWWREREEASIGALISLRSAMTGPGEHIYG
ncbi:hypothetical protein M1O55_03580 [Dehalococcoidia bacterium]|nr:hypothetical protein [Dehalococcoidia bacterium]